MMAWVSAYTLFLAKAATVVVAVLIIAGGMIMLSARGKSSAKQRLKVKHLNRHYDDLKRVLQAEMLSKRDLRRRFRRDTRQLKSKANTSDPQAPKLFVLSFNGDIRASAVSALREEITAILRVATPRDEVVLRLESSGGLVHTYGLAAAQLLRFKQQQVPLTVAVDKVAASGGYMMACVAQHIIAAPFAILGSIGVVAQLPNFHRWLRENHIDFEQLTAGDSKRTLTLFGENTSAERDKARAELEDTHALFKAFINDHRGMVDIDEVATGEHWYGTRALDLKLIDELRTSDDYLLAASESREIFEVTYTARRSLISKMLQGART